MNFRNTCRACSSLFRIRMAEGLQYRVSAISGTVVGVFWALLECVLFTVFYTYSENGSWNNNGLSLPQTISYVWLAQGGNHLFSSFSIKMLAMLTFPCYINFIVNARKTDVFLHMYPKYNL